MGMACICSFPTVVSSPHVAAAKLRCAPCGCEAEFSRACDLHGATWSWWAPDFTAPARISLRFLLCFPLLFSQADDPLVVAKVASSSSSVRLVVRAAHPGGSLSSPLITTKASEPTLTSPGWVMGPTLPGLAVVVRNQGRNQGAATIRKRKGHGK